MNKIQATYCGQHAYRGKRMREEKEGLTGDSCCSSARKRCVLFTTDGSVPMKGTAYCCTSLLKNRALLHNSHQQRLNIQIKTTVNTCFKSWEGN